MSRSAVEGFEIAFHASLCEPITIAGAPRTFAILNGTFTAVVTLGLQVPWLGLPLGCAAHLLAYALVKRDVYIFDALGRHIKHKTYLDA